MKIGDRFDYEDENIHGHIAEVVKDEDRIFLIIAMDDGRWASVDASKLEPVSYSLH